MDRINKPHKACDAVIGRVKFPAMVMPKIDGVRACHLNNEFTTRTLKPFRNSRLSEAFENKHNTGYDGELAAGRITSPSLCRNTTSFTNSHDVNTLEHPLPVWWIFDCIRPSTIHLPYANRYDILREEIISRINPFVQLVPIEIVSTIEELEAAHAKYINEGYEGTVIRDPMGMHKDGRCTVREGAFLRIKDLGDEECVILELIEAEENLNEKTVNELGNATRTSHKENKIPKGMIGSLLVRIPDGRVITIGAGNMNHDERIRYWESQHEIIGKTCTYKFMIHGEKDMRRHPRFKNFREGDI